MLIINADDWGANPYTTDKIVDCIQKNIVTSVSAMVFMEDSKRAAELASKKKIDTGLHLNFSQHFTGNNVPDKLCQYQAKIVSWLKSSKFAQAIYNPFLRNEFEYVFNFQYQEYIKLYNKEPSRIDGHNHMHLCANMLVGQHIPLGTCVRKNITFTKIEKKNLLNKFIRMQIDSILSKRYICTDYFFHIRQISPDSINVQHSVLNGIMNLAIHSVLELLVHPGQKIDFDYVTCEEFCERIKQVKRCSFSEFHSDLNYPSNLSDSRLA